MELCTDKNDNDMLSKIFQRHLSAAVGVLLLTASGCEVLDDDMKKHGNGDDTLIVELDHVARILSEIPLEKDHVKEVRTAVLASSSNGYDEEYTMRDLFEDPGRGVGDAPATTKAAKSAHANPLRALIEEHVRSSVQTRSSTGVSYDPDEFLAALSSSDIQIYWPFSENWDESQMPVITFDPEDGADANIGYRLVINDDGSRLVEEVIVDEELAREVPVWVVNRNSDAEYTSLELLRREDPAWGEGGGTIIVKPQTRSEKSGVKSLVLKNFTMRQHYDTWFAGASEFFVKVGAVDDFTAATESELLMYNPQITDFMVVVKRSQLGKPQPFNVMLVSDWNEQMTHCVFMITEDDGGTRTEWKCTALVRIASKSYGVEINLPFKTRDDIVWRGQLTQRWLEAASSMTGNFGDVDMTFEVVEY